MVWPQIGLGIVLIGLSLGLLRLHRRERQAEAGGASGPGGRRGAPVDRGRHQRRSLASALIGVAGMMLLGGLAVHSPAAVAIYWSIALLVVVALLTIGVIDLLRSRRYLSDLYARHHAEREALEREIAAHMRRRAASGPTSPRSPTDEPQEE